MKTLKHLSMMLMLAIAAFGMASCGDDDSKDSGSLLGYWYMEDESNYYLIYNFSNTTLTGAELWKDNGKWYKEYLGTIDYTVKGNQITINGLTGTYSIKGNTLTLSSEGETRIFHRMTSEMQNNFDQATPIFKE